MCLIAQCLLVCCSCYLSLNKPYLLLPLTCCLVLYAVFIVVCLCSVFYCSVFLLQCVVTVFCSAVLWIIKAFNPPQLLSLDNLVSTVSNEGHNHCVGFPSGQRWSVWPGRRLALACFCPELATKPRRRKAGLLKQKWEDDGNSRWAAEIRMWEKKKSAMGLVKSFCRKSRHSLKVEERMA